MCRLGRPAEARSGRGRSRRAPVGREPDGSGPAGSVLARVGPPPVGQPDGGAPAPREVAGRGWRRNATPAGLPRPRPRLVGVGAQPGRRAASGRCCSSRKPAESAPTSTIDGARRCWPRSRWATGRPATWKRRSGRVSRASRSIEPARRSRSRRRSRTSWPSSTSDWGTRARPSKHVAAARAAFEAAGDQFWLAHVAETEAQVALAKGSLDEATTKAANAARACPRKTGNQKAEISSLLTEARVAAGPWGRGPRRRRSWESPSSWQEPDPSPACGRSSREWSELLAESGDLQRAYELSREALALV